MEAACAPPWGEDRTGDAVRFARLDPSHAPAVAALQDLGLGDRMYPVTPGQIACMLGAEGVTIGAFQRDRLVGFFALWFPGAHPDSMGLAFGLWGAELQAVAHWTAVIVHPDLRGQGLQRRLVAALGARLFPEAPREFGFVTVRTDNHASFRSMLAAGFMIVDAAPKYDGHPRYTLFRMAPAEPLTAKDGCRVPVADLATQQGLLADGWLGHRHDADTDTLLFARPWPGGVVEQIRSRRTAR